MTRGDGVATWRLQEKTRPRSGETMEEAWRGRGGLGGVATGGGDGESAAAVEDG